MLKVNNTFVLTIRRLKHSLPKKTSGDDREVTSQDRRRESFPDLKAKQLRRGTGGRSSFNGHVVTVFGGNGFVGRTLVNKLAKEGAQLIIPYRSDYYEVQKLKLSGDLGQVLFSRFDLRDEESILKALKYSNVCINLIGKDSETNNFSFQDVHVNGARAIARACRELGVKRLVHVSALNACPAPEGHLIRGGSGFLKSKFNGELAVREEFPAATIIRPADIHGQEDRFSWYYTSWQRRQYRQVALYKGGFDVFKAPVYVSDVAQAIHNAITDDEAPGQTYAAVGPRHYELRSLVQYINAIIQKTEDEYYYIKNLQWAPLFFVKLLLLSKPNWLRKYPRISLEKLERECISDAIPKDMKTIEELGVKLTRLEDKWEFNLAHLRRLSYYGNEVGEIPPLEKPRPVQLIN